MAAVSWRDLEMAYEYISSNPDFDNSAWVCRTTGKIYWHSELGDNFEELPDDIYESDDYVEIPNKRDLDLGKRLVFRFADEYLPNDYERVEDIFARRGAYGRFKGLLEERELLEKWYQYEEDARNRALREWCEQEEIEIADTN